MTRSTWKWILEHVALPLVLFAAVMAVDELLRRMP